MTLNELKIRYVRVRDEIDTLGRAGDQSEARRARLMFELDEIDQEFAAIKRRALTAPTLRDVVNGADSSSLGLTTISQRLRFG
jgi:hypothetical protein